MSENETLIDSEDINIEEQIQENDLPEQREKSPTHYFLPGSIMDFNFDELDLDDSSFEKMFEKTITKIKEDELVVLLMVNFKPNSESGSVQIKNIIRNVSPN